MLVLCYNSLNVVVFALMFFFYLASLKRSIIRLLTYWIIYYSVINRILLELHKINNSLITSILQHHIILVKILFNMCGSFIEIVWYYLNSQNTIFCFFCCICCYQLSLLINLIKIIKFERPLTLNKGICKSSSFSNDFYHFKKHIYNH